MATIISNKGKKALRIKHVRTKEGYVQLDEFLASIGSKSSVDNTAYFSITGLLKELLLD